MECFSKVSRIGLQVSAGGLCDVSINITLEIKAKLRDLNPTAGEEHRLRFFEKMALRRIFLPKRD
jgi:hypothetical protein